MEPSLRIEPPKTHLLFWGMAVAAGVAAFAIGYRTPHSLPVNTSKVEQASVHASNDHGSMPAQSSALHHDGLQVEGFAKIGFAEMRDLLVAASLQQREQWAQELGALPDRPLKPIALVAFYTAWLNLEPEEAIRSLRNFPDLINRTPVFSALVGSAPPVVLPQMIDVISQLSTDERRLLLPAALGALDETDPEAAARFLDSHPQLVSDSDAATLLTAWAGENVDAARRWLDASAFSDNSGALRSLVNAWLAKDPSGAQDYVVLHRQSDAIARVATLVAARLFNTSPEQAGNFIRLFDKSDAGEMLGSMVAAADDSQVPQMVAWALTILDPADGYNLGNALHRWDFLDSAQVVSWLRDQPTAKRESLVTDAVQYGGYASPALMSLAFELSDPQKRDRALTGLVSNIPDEEQNVQEKIRAFGLPAAQTKHLLELRAAYEKAAATNNP